MAALVDRSYQGERDLERASDCLVASRAQIGKDRAPTTRRLELLATSRLWEPAQDAHVWEEPAEGAPIRRLVGFALLWRREETSPYLSLEVVTDIGDTPGDLARDMLDWAMNRATALETNLQENMTLSVATFDDQQRLQAILRGSGFALQDGHNVYMTCALDERVPVPDAPEGVSIRPLLEETELDRYVSLYSFAPMNVDHRLELMRSPDYVHLVAVAPNGDFVAFCECSIDREEWGRGGRHTGWVEYVGVRQDLQGRGLGRAIVADGLRWLKSGSAQTAALITMGTNIAAQRMYKAVGFTISERDYIYTR
jgi:ribosomal protein S18 acetylase RimI-like enzyme